MKTLSMLLGAGLTVAAFGAQAQKAPDAVAIDPDHHHVILENDRVRVFEVLADKGARAPMHSHPPFVLVSLGQARLRMTMADGKKVIFDLKPGQVLWMEDVEHSWELIAGQGHVIAVEVK